MCCLHGYEEKLIIHAFGFQQIEAGFEPSKETLKKLRRRCIREVDNENDEKVESLAKKCQIRMGSENRRNMLFNMDYSRGRA